MAACSGSDLKKPAEGSAGLQPDAVSDEGEEGGSQPEPLLDADATDEELLEALGDEVHVVTDEDYIKMVKEFQEHTEAYAGQIYQVEGVFTMENDTPCIARAVANGLLSFSQPARSSACIAPYSYIIFSALRVFPAHKGSIRRV